MLAAVLHSFVYGKMCMYVYWEWIWFFPLYSICMHIFFQFQCSIACKRFQCAWWIFVCCSSNPYRKTPCNCRRQRLAHVDVCRALNNKIQFSFLSFFCSVSQLFHQLQRERRETTRESYYSCLSILSFILYLQLLAKLCFLSSSFHFHSFFHISFFNILRFFFFYNTFCFIFI